MDLNLRFWLFCYTLHMRKILFGVLLTLLIIILGSLTILGLVPGLSSLIGAGPKDLGIRITKQDSQSAIAKVGSEFISIKSSDTIKDYTFEGKSNRSFTMDSKELTAHSNNRPWKNYPAKDVQVFIHQDGTIESSGRLVISKAIPYAMGLGYSEVQIRDAMQKYFIPPFEVPFYVEGNGSVLRDSVIVDARNIKVGAVSLPAEIVAKVNIEAESVLNDIIQKHSNSFHAESVTVADGKMKFKGQVPQKVFVFTQE